jgi:hypothetical protein
MGFAILDFGFWILDFGFWILDFGLFQGDSNTIEKLFSGKGIMRPCRRQFTAKKHIGFISTATRRFGCTFTSHRSKARQNFGWSRLLRYRIIKDTERMS